jgi:PAS domain S-box-containing protein
MKNKTQKESVTSVIRKNAEEEYARNQANKIESPIEVDAKKLLHELEVHRIELEMQNEELTRAKEQADLATEKYTGLYDFAPSGYFTLSRDGKIIELNLSGTQILDKERSKLIKSYFSFFVSKETKPVFNLFLEKVFSSKDTQTCEVILTTKGILPLYLHLSGIVAVDNENCLITAVDITNRKLAEESLADSVKQWKTTFDGVNDGICILNLDQQIIQSNKIMDDLFPGYHGAFTGKPCWEVVHGTNEPFHDCPVGKMKKSLQRETSIQKHNGRWFQVTADPLFDDHRHLKGAVHIIRDITESKQAEDALRLSEERWRKLVKTIPDYVALYDHEGKYLFLNRYAEGFSEKDIEGKFYDDFLTDDSKTLYRKAFEEAKISSITQQFEHNAIGENWSTSFYESYLVPIYEDGRFVNMLVIARDITDRKKAVAELINAKEYAENLIQTANAIVVGLDTNGNIMTYNKAAEEITGYTLAELQGQNWFEVSVPRGRFPEVWEIFEKLMEGGLLGYFENPILTKSGEERYIIWHNNEVREHDKITGSISFGIDITKRPHPTSLFNLHRNLILPYRKRLNLIRMTK